MKTYKELMNEKKGEVFQFSKQGNMTRVNKSNGQRAQWIEVDSEKYTYNTVHKTYNSKTNVILSKTMFDNLKKLHMLENTQAVEGFKADKK